MGNKTMLANVFTRIQHFTSGTIIDKISTRTLQTNIISKLPDRTFIYLTECAYDAHSRYSDGVIDILEFF